MWSNTCTPCLGINDPHSRFPSARKVCLECVSATQSIHIVASYITLSCGSWSELLSLVQRGSHYGLFYAWRKPLRSLRYRTRRCYACPARFRRAANLRQRDGERLGVAVKSGNIRLTVAGRRKKRFSAGGTVASTVGSWYI